MKEKYYIYVSELLKDAKPCEYCKELENSSKNSIEEVEQYIKDIKILYNYLLIDNNFIDISILELIINNILIEVKKLW